MTLAVTFTSWLLALHLLSAFALAGSLALFWYLILASRNVDTPQATVAMGPVAGVGTMVVRAGGIGTLVFGIWLAIRLDHVQIWSGWIIAAIVLWALMGAIGGRTGKYYTDVQKLAEEGGESAQQEVVARLRAPTGALLHLATVLVFVLILLDMIFKPGA